MPPCLDQRVNYTRSQQKQAPLILLSAAPGFVLGLFFGPEYESCSFPQKCQAVSKLEGYTSQKTILFLVIVAVTDLIFWNFVTSIQVYSTDVIKLEAFIVFCDSILWAWFLIIQ
jgi:hypothetical protein